MEKMEKVTVNKINYIKKLQYLMYFCINAVWIVINNPSLNNLHHSFTDTADKKT